MSHSCVLGDSQEKGDEVMSHSCVLVDGQEKRDQVMSHSCVRGWSREEG